MTAPQRFLLLGFMLNIPFLLLLTATPSWAEVECGDTIEPNEVAVLTKDLDCAHDPGETALTLEANSFLNLGSHTVKCTDNSTAGIRINGEGSTLQNGTVTNCSIGVIVGGTGVHLIKKVMAVTNHIGFRVLEGSNGNTLTYNTAKDSEGRGFLASSNDNEFSHNKALNVVDTEPGFTINGDRNTIKFNLAKKNMGGGILYNREQQCGDQEPGALK